MSISLVMAADRPSRTPRRAPDRRGAGPDDSGSPSSEEDHLEPGWNHPPSAEPENDVALARMLGCAMLVGIGMWVALAVWLF